MIQLQIETTGVCNARCGFCPYPTATRPKGRMKQELFTKLIEEAATIPQIVDVCLTGLGEPMLDPHIVQRVAQVRATMPPNTRIVLFTNGTYLTPYQFDQLKAAGISAVMISLNASTAKERLNNMDLVDWDVVNANIAHALQNRGDVVVEIRAVVNHDSFPEESARQLNMMYGSVYDGTGFVRLIQEGNWSGDNRLIPNREIAPNEHCFRATNHIYITYKGLVTTCCQDPLGKQVFGDASMESIRSIYNSPRFQKFREDHANNRADLYDICKNCTRM